MLHTLSGAVIDALQINNPGQVINWKNCFHKKVFFAVDPVTCQKSMSDIYICKFHFSMFKDHIVTQINL